MLSFLCALDRRIARWLTANRRPDWNSGLDQSTADALRERGAAAIFDMIVLALLFSVLLALALVQSKECFPSAISQFYWRYLGWAVLSLLSLICGMMLVQRGETWIETALGILGAFALLGVVWFPTEISACASGFTRARVFALLQMEGGAPVAKLSEQPFGDPRFNIAHIISVVVFVLVLFIHCRWLFTRMKPGLHEGPLPSSDAERARAEALRARKARRNERYRLCGWFILGGGAVLGAITAFGARAPRFMELWSSVSGTFWVEAIVLAAFAYAWGLKGRVICKELQDEHSTKPGLFFRR